MKSVWNIAGSTVSATWSALRPLPAAWLESMSSHRAALPNGRPADLELELFEETGRPGHDPVTQVTVSTIGTGKHRRISIRQPTASGEIIEGETGYRGRIDLLVPARDCPAHDAAVRTAFSLLCEDRGRLLLHSSAVERRGRAWLFTGPGGAGKTTIASRLNGGGEPLAVDRVVISYDREGEPIAHSTPFSDTGRILGGPRSRPIAGICFIEKAPRHELRRMEPFEALTALLRETTAFSRDRGRVEQTLAGVGRLVDDGKCFALRFAKDEGFWPLLDAIGKGSS